ncbi:MAG: DUF1844 domain-containing protein [Armatimonadota bacterium]|nr:DUF1844 domain-containing protein [bacterium]MDW8320662.1 DUF1844 domain-containing protein [Armatimonadota bacterium]
MEEQPQSQWEESTQEQTPQQPVDVITVALWMIEEMQAQAWIKMGLWKDPVSGELRTDLPQAKIAIDCVAALTEVLKAHLTETQRRDLERLLTDLRLNFVQRTAE